MMFVDRKTGHAVKIGDMLIRKDYKGFKRRYQVLDFNRDDTVHVRKLGSGDRWIFLDMPFSALQLDKVII